MKTHLPSLALAIVITSTICSFGQSYQVFSTGFPQYEPAPVDYTTTVIYEQPVIYQAPVTYYGPVYYVNAGAPPPQYEYEPLPCASPAFAPSTVCVIGGERGPYSYANSGHCNPNVIVFGRRDGWR